MAMTARSEAVAVRTATGDARARQRRATKLKSPNPSRDKHRRARQLTTAQAVEGNIGVGERKGYDLGCDGDAPGKLEKLLRILPGQIGDGFHHALAPSQSAGHGGNGAHVDTAEHDGPALAHRGRRDRQQGAHRRKNNGGIGRAKQ
jgi:hypothetical protein